MATYVETAVIDAPVEAVFDFRLDFANLPRYNPDVVDLRLVTEPDAATGAGAVYEFGLRLPLGITRPAALSVLEVERPTSIEIEIDAFIAAREACRFEDRGAATFIEFATEVATPGGPIAPVLDRLFVLPTGRKQVRRELDLMAELLTASVWPP